MIFRKVVVYGSLNSQSTTVLKVRGMNGAMQYQGLAYVTFETLSEQSPVELTQIALIDLGNSTYELRSKRQVTARRLIITPINQKSIQGNIISRAPGVTTFRRSVN